MDEPFGGPGRTVPIRWCDCLCLNCVFERHGRCEVEYGCPETVDPKLQPPNRNTA